MTEAIFQKLDVLLLELESLQGVGISIWLDGKELKTIDPSDAVMVSEEDNYMRDYVLDDGGRVTELRFDKVYNSKKK